MMRSDAELILACQRGDDTAWAEFLQRYQRLIYAIPGRAGLSPDDADEVFQRTFLLLLGHLTRIEQPERIGAWLVTTTRRECWRFMRGQRAEATQPLDPTDDDQTDMLPDDQPLPGEALLLLERQHAVRQSLAELDERCRTLLELLFYRETPPPYAEIAAAIGTSEGSIGPTRARCLQKLRKKLELLDL